MSIIIWLESQKLMNKNRNKKNKSSQVPTFVGKLLQIVENREIQEVVSWTTTRDSFIIKNITRFTEEVLPSYFKHHNFASFIRQLNMYGFKKIRHSQGDNVYMNEHFKQGSKHLLPNINRKLKEEKQQVVALYNGGMNLSEGGKVGKQIQDLRLKQKNLQQMCKRFLVQNQRLLEENQNLVKKMDKQSKQKETRLEQFLIYLLAQKNSRALGNGENEQLSLTNNIVSFPLQSNSEDMRKSDATPLELIANNMEQNDSFKKMKTLIQNAYNRRVTKRRDNNFTIIPPKQGAGLAGKPFEQHFSVPSDYQDPIVDAPQMRQPDPDQPDQNYPLHDEDQKSFLSINDFINAEDYPDFNLQSSN